VNALPRTVSVGGVPTYVLFDSGSTNSFITPEVVAKFTTIFEEKEVNILIHTASDQPPLQTRRILLEVPVVILRTTLPANLLIMPMRKFEVILGMDWLSGYHAQIECAKSRVVFELGGQTKLVYIRVSPSVGAVFESALRVESMLVQGEAYLVTLTTVGGDNEEDTKVEDIPTVGEFADVLKALEGLPPPRSNPFAINLEVGATPIAKSPYRMAPAELAELKQQLGDLLEKGFIRPSSSPWEAPVLFVKKKDGSMRLCIDYRGINNNYDSSIGMSPFEAMYGRPCRTPLCWTEVGERTKFDQWIVDEAVEKIQFIRDDNRFLIN